MLLWQRVLLYPYYHLTRRMVRESNAHIRLEHRRTEGGIPPRPFNDATLPEGRTHFKVDIDLSGGRGVNDRLAGGISRYDLPVDRKSTRLNSSHVAISYAVFCLKKKTGQHRQ